MQIEAGASDAFFGSTFADDAFHSIPCARNYIEDESKMARSIIVPARHAGAISVESVSPGHNPHHNLACGIQILQHDSLFSSSLITFLLTR
jgi:hypothetical protein